MSYRGLFLVSLLVVAGCKEEEDGQAIDRDAVANQVVKAICTPFAACDCEESSAIEENDDCDEATFPIVHGAMANAADLALRYHSECLGRFNAYTKLLGCDAPDELEEEALDEALFDLERCKFVAGTGGRGEPCQQISGAGVSLGDTCAHDLVCDGTLCRPFPSKRGDWCGGIFTCPGGLECLDPEGDGLLLCEEPAGDGDNCNPHDASPCAQDLFCDLMTFECDELPGEGEPCLNGLCQEGLVCPLDTCVSLPTTGEPCPDFICDPTVANCNPTTTMCEGHPDEGEPCVGQCQPGLLCGADAVCVEAPAAVCGLVENVGLCLYQGDGICDEPEGTDLCREGTDPGDCAATTDPTDPTFTTGGTFDPTITSGDPTLTGDPTFGTDPTITSGDPTFGTDPTSASATLTSASDTSDSITSGDATFGTTG